MGAHPVLLNFLHFVVNRVWKTQPNPAFERRTGRSSMPAVFAVQFPRMPFLRDIVVVLSVLVNGTITIDKTSPPVLLFGSIYFVYVNLVQII